MKNCVTLSPGAGCLVNLVVGFFLLYGTLVYGADVGAKAAARHVENVGFMRKPPLELVQRFPMCNVFLEVRWIDKEKKIGISRYDLYDESGEKRRQQIMALIDLDDETNIYTPRYDISLDSYELKTEKENLRTVRVAPNRLADLFSFIRKGKIDRANSSLRIRHGNAAISLFSNLLYGSLAGRRVTVCVPYPDGKRVWIAEGRSVKNALDADALKQLKSTLAKGPIRNPEFSVFRFLPNLDVVDVNFDGVVDYVGNSGLFYSTKDGYAEATPSTESSALNDGGWIFPASGKRCNIVAISGFFYTTDGSSYYLNNQCNLTEVTAERN